MYSEFRQNFPVIPVLHQVAYPPDVWNHPLRVYLGLEHWISKRLNCHFLILVQGFL